MTNITSRVRMFQEFVEALRKWGAGGCSVLIFEDGHDPEVVTFRYRGKKLRIRHTFTFNQKDHPWVLTSKKPEDAARRVPSKLELLEAREHPEKDVPLASLEGIKADWTVNVPASKDADPHNKRTFSPYCTSQSSRKQFSRSLRGNGRSERKPMLRSNRATHQHAVRSAAVFDRP